MTYHEIRELLTHAEYPALSLIIKTERAMPEAAQNRIRIKNAVKQGLEKMQGIFLHKNLLILKRCC